MHLARLWVLIMVVLAIICLGLVACGGYSTGPNNGGGTPGPTPTSGGY